MRVVIAGGHGKIALLLERLLVQRGDQAVGLIRNPAHAGEVSATGAVAEVCDLEAASVDEVAALLDGADAVVFAAGAGPGSGALRKDTVDRGASVLLAGAASRAGVRRFVQISGMGVDQPPAPGTDEVWAAYHRGQGRRRGRPAGPGPGLDDPAARRADRRPRHRPGPAWPRPRSPGARCPGPTWPRSSWPCSTTPATAGQTLDLISGDTPIVGALRQLG